MAKETIFIKFTLGTLLGQLLRERYLGKCMWLRKKMEYFKIPLCFCQWNTTHTHKGLNTIEELVQSMVDRKLENQSTYKLQMWVFTPIVTPHFSYITRRNIPDSLNMRWEAYCFYGDSCLLCLFLTCSDGN